MLPIREYLIHWNNDHDDHRHRYCRCLSLQKELNKKPKEKYKKTRQNIKRSKLKLPTLRNKINLENCVYWKKDSFFWLSHNILCIWVVLCWCLNSVYLLLLLCLFNVFFRFLSSQNQWRCRLATNHQTRSIQMSLVVFQ